MYTFFGIMALRPDIQRQAQCELDSVLGQDRMPTFDDRSSLPFIDCIVFEVLRWNVITPLGRGHFAGSSFRVCSQQHRFPTHGYRRGRVSRLSGSKRIDRLGEHLVRPIELRLVRLYLTSEGQSCETPRYSQTRNSSILPAFWPRRKVVRQHGKSSSRRCMGGESGIQPFIFTHLWH